MHPLHEFSGNRCVHCGVNIATSGYSEGCPARRASPPKIRRSYATSHPIPPTHHTRTQPESNLLIVVGGPIAIVGAIGLLISYFQSQEAPPPPPPVVFTAPTAISQPHFSNLNPLLLPTATGRDWIRASDEQKAEFCAIQARAMQQFLPGRGETGSAPNLCGPRLIWRRQKAAKGVILNC